jgi:exonuclease III
LGGSFSLWSNGERASRGVAILFNTDQGVVIKKDKKDNDGRVLPCEIKIENQIYNLINIYCPNNNAERKQLILSIDRYMYLDIDGPTYNILNGDFNCVLDKKKLDRLPSRSYDQQGTTELRDLILKCNLTDIGRDQNQIIKKYTFQRGKV